MVSYYPGEKAEPTCTCAMWLILDSMVASWVAWRSSICSMLVASVLIWYATLARDWVVKFLVSSSALLLSVAFIKNDRKRYLKFKILFLDSLLPIYYYFLFKSWSPYYYYLNQKEEVVFGRTYKVNRKQASAPSRYLTPELAVPKTTSAVIRNWNLNWFNTCDEILLSLQLTQNWALNLKNTWNAAHFTVPIFLTDTRKILNFSDSGSGTADYIAKTLYLRIYFPLQMWFFSDCVGYVICYYAMYFKGILPCFQRTGRKLPTADYPLGLLYQCNVYS